MLDKLGRFSQYWSKFTIFEDIDLIVLSKQDVFGKKKVSPPSGETGVRVHQLGLSY